MAGELRPDSLTVVELATFLWELVAICGECHDMVHGHADDLGNS